MVSEEVTRQLIFLQQQLSNLRKLKIERMSDEVGKILSDQIFAYLQEQPQMTEVFIDMPKIWIRHDERPIIL